MTLRQTLLFAFALVASATPAAGQRTWVEVTAPHLTVVSDAGAGRARDFAWQFEQIREALARTFPWVRLTGSRPLVVVAARNANTMRTLVPGLFEPGKDGNLFVSASATGHERSYVVVRGDVRGDDREGISPYQPAYWSFTAQALGETSRNLPLWAVRGLSEVLSNTLVRESEIQVGRVLPQNLAQLRNRPRLALKDVVTATNHSMRARPAEELFALDAHAWAFVHFLVWADRGAYAPLFDKYVNGVLNGADPVASIASTLGDVSRFENAFAVYIARDVFFFAKFEADARVSRDGFTVRDLTNLEAVQLRGGLHAAMDRPADARAAAVEAEKIGPAGAGAEIMAFVTDDNDDAALRTALEQAVKQPGVSWWAPYRLAALIAANDDRAATGRVVTLLTQATTLNPNADFAWTFLGESLSAVGRGDDAVAAVTKGIALMPASSAHRLSLARTYHRLGRYPEGLKAAGVGRALAKLPADLAQAQQVLGALAAAASRAQTGPAEPSAEPSTPVAASPAGAPTIVVEPAAGTTELAPGADIGSLIDQCYGDNTNCARILPLVVQDCKAGNTVTSTAACREAGYIVDAGVGVPARPALAADYYRLGCTRRDDLSCVRLATLQSLGRGVPRDADAALDVLDPACASGVQEACFRLGLHLSATGGAADRRRAREVLEASCTAKFAESCAALKKLPTGR
jgi:TPR repeat protein